jgi:hypothetical protein
MRVPARKGVARVVNDLRDGLDDGRDRGLEEAAADAADQLGMLLEREELETAELERFDTGSRVKVKLTRGNAVRDQEEWTLEAEGRDPADAADGLNQQLRRLENEWGPRVRSLDPTDDG